MAQNQPKEDSNSSPKPSVSVSLGRQAIREDDNVQVQAWLANESDLDFTFVKLHVAAPQFIRWYVGTCEEWQQKNYKGGGGQPISLGAISAHGVHSAVICLRSSPDIIAGDGFGA